MNLSAGLFSLCTLLAIAGCASSKPTSNSGPSETSGSSSGSGPSSGAGGGSGANGGASGESASGSSGTSTGSGSSSGSTGGDNGADAGDAGVVVSTAQPDCGTSTMYPQTSFVNLAVAPGAKLDPNENDPLSGDAGVSGPAGWHFYGKDGAVCRDGSPTGFYVHYANPASNKLFIYLEGGGACSSATFCSHNPANMATTFAGGAATQGQTIVGSLTFATTPQEPYVATPAQGTTAAYSPGMFDFTNAANPFKDWSGVYVPYCTGDVHFGTLDNVTIPGDGLLAALPNQHFVGHLNLQKFIARIVPTFPNVTQVVFAGASAGAFGVGLNYGMVQDSFGPAVQLIALNDSGPAFSEQYLPACLQKNWTKLWGFDGALPKDCAECSMADGSGPTNIYYYWMHKYPKLTLGVVSTMQDEVIRLFFAQGDSSCASDNATSLTLAQAAGGYTGAQYTLGLNDFKTTFQCSGRVATYYIGGTNANYMHPTYHQHIFRDEFYKAITNDGKVTMAQWVTDFIAGKIEQVGP